MANLTHKSKFSEKKTRSVAAVRVTHDMVATGANQLFNLPPNALVVDAAVIVEAAGQANLTVDFGYTGAANAFGNDLDIDGTGVVTVPQAIAALTLTEGTPNTLSAGTVTKSPRILTGTGLEVIATFSEDPSAGTFVFIVEYIEFDKGNGELMNLSTT